MDHRKVYDSFTSWLVIAAALVVLFSSMLEPQVAFILCVGMAVVFAAIKLIQSRKSFEKRGEKLS